MTAVTESAAADLVGSADSGTDPMVPHRYRVVRRRLETRDTVTQLLEPLDEPIPAFAPGQFAMLYAFGVGEVPISMSGDPSRVELLQHTLRNVGAVTGALCAARPGAVIGVRGPFGTSWDLNSAYGHDLVFIAGGIGLAPLRSALLQALSQRERYRRLVLLLGVRNPDELMFRKDLRSWKGLFDVDVEITVDRGAPGWRGQVGVVTTLLPQAPFDPDNAVAFVCGPEVMLRFTALGLSQRGVSAQRIRLSTERNMKCGVGLCGHCQLGPVLVCRDGPVFSYDRLAPLLHVREL
jgi:NAD(P)H-flavin reductase